MNNDLVASRIASRQADRAKACNDIFSFIQAGKLPDDSFLFAKIPGKKGTPIWDKNPDVVSHFIDIEREFWGGCRLLYFHACVIVCIRRKIHLDSALRCFFSLWSIYRQRLRKTLSIRWLISALDTLVDHGNSPIQKALAMNGSMFGTMIQLINFIIATPGAIITDTEGYIENSSPDDIEQWRALKAIPRVIDGDMVAKMHKQIQKMCTFEEKIAGPICAEIYWRILFVHPTIFSSIRELCTKIPNSDSEADGKIKGFPVAGSQLARIPPLFTKPPDE